MSLSLPITSSLLEAADLFTPDQRSGLSQREFVREYQSRRQPVLLTDAIDHWPARHWTPETLKSQLGDRPVTIRTESGPVQYPFNDLCDQILASRINAPAPYARNIDLARELPELWPEVQPRIQYATPDWKSSRLLPRDFIFPNGLQELFFGGEGCSFPRLHVDYWGIDGFVSQIYGTKEVVLISPDQTAYVYPGADGGLTSQIDQFESPDLARFPLFRHAEVIRVLLQPGQTLYVPNGWWHTTWMPEVSITVITATWHRHNWPDFIRQYRERGKTRSVAKLAVLTWLKSVGIVLGLRDRFLNQ